MGAWTYTDTQNCGKDASGKDLKCGKVTTGTRTASEGSGFCGGKQFTFATISYEWTAHNNQSTLSAPPDKVADTFNATWTSGTTPNITQQYTFNITVPAVRPDHETTEFVDWWPEFPTEGEWKAKLHPPSSDPTFDFSGESVQEADPGGGGPDTCHFDGSKYEPFTTVTGIGKSLTVESGNIWEFDDVGWRPNAVTYYRTTLHGPDPLHVSAPCGTTLPQQMIIKAPSDTAYHNYGKVNLLGASMTKTKVTSKRAGKSKTEIWPKKSG